MVTVGLLTFALDISIIEVKRAEFQDVIEQHKLLPLKFEFNCLCVPKVGSVASDFLN
jgi:hypothetical protein